MRCLIILGLSAFALVGCHMASPGVASFRSTTPTEIQQSTIFNDSWVDQPERSNLHQLPENELSIDISERQLGKSYIDPETRESRYMSGAERRQLERRKKRHAERMAQYGGDEATEPTALGKHRSAFAPKSDD